MARGRRRNKSDSVLFKSAEWVGWALAGLEREIVDTRARLARLNEQAAMLRGRVGVAAKRGEAAARTRRPGGMSAEGRKRISEMMKKRWIEAKKKNKTRL
jgi:hypothetical protein